MSSLLMFRVTITMPDGSRGRHTTPFADGFEAALQTLADFPEATKIAVIFVGSLPMPTVEKAVDKTVDKKERVHESV
jgi:hypothetical protein